jgi:hypothetical protein
MDEQRRKSEEAENFQKIQDQQLDDSVRAAEAAAENLPTDGADLSSSGRFDTDKDSKKSTGAGLRYRRGPDDNDVLMTKSVPTAKVNRTAPHALEAETASAKRKKLAHVDGTKLRKLKEEIAKKSSETTETDEKPKSSSFLSYSTEDKAENDIDTDEDTGTSLQYYFARYRVPRKQSRPVEQILSISNQKGSYYDILGIRRSASMEQIRKSFRARSLLVHPGKAMNMTEQFFSAEI